MSYIAILVVGGIIDTVKLYATEDEAKTFVKAQGRDGFDPESDDYKVFNDQDECVYSYETEDEEAVQP